MIQQRLVNLFLRFADPVLRAKRRDYIVTAGRQAMEASEANRSQARRTTAPEPRPGGGGNSKPFAQDVTRREGETADDFNRRRLDQAFSAFTALR